MARRDGSVDATGLTFVAAAPQRRRAHARPRAVTVQPLPPSPFGIAPRLRTGVHRYRAEEVTGWDGFHRGLLARGELLIEEVIDQHPVLAAVCVGTVNTTRVTAFFDGERTHIVAMAQKFGRGAVSDQNVRIADFQLPMIDEVREFVDEIARGVPQVRYVGWDVVVTLAGPVLVEGDWGAGVYENKPSVTGIRTGHKTRYCEAIRF